MKQKAEQAPRQKGVNGREKGKRFERQCAKEIVKAVGAPFTSKDCYRTPSSGGHPYIQGCDTQISPRLQRILPLGCEMKHRDEFTLAQFFRSKMPKSLAGYHRQAVKACRGEYAHLKPVLVVRGSEEVSFACLTRKDFGEFLGAFAVADRSASAILYQFENKAWIAVLWSEFLEIIRHKGEHYRASPLATAG